MSYRYYTLILTNIQHYIWKIFQIRDNLKYTNFTSQKSQPIPLYLPCTFWFLWTHFYFYIVLSSEHLHAFSYMKVLMSFCICSEKLNCPMCSIVLPPRAIHLLNEHVDSHLEKICPICSQAFSKNVKQEE